MKLLIDMNLSPEWVNLFRQQGWQSVHWSTVGDPRSPDYLIMEWARENGYVVFTHDLDFGNLLALTHAQSPSVIQVRTQDVMPKTLGSIVIQILKKYKSVLKTGALVVIDENKSRLRILPFP